MRCGACGQPHAEGQNYCIRCGASLSFDGGGSMAGDSTGGVIPYKNPLALTAYYLGCFSVLPFIGLFLGAGAVTLGILGLKKRKENPHIRGTLHAWVGILFGGLMMLLCGAMVVLLIIVSLGSGF